MSSPTEATDPIGTLSLSTGSTSPGGAVLAPPRADDLAEPGPSFAPPTPPAADEPPLAPEDPPTGSRRALSLWPEALVVLAALVTNLSNLTVNGLANEYYSAAVRSMTASWHNFFFASFDPGGWITVDKPPVGLWLEALSARALGVSSFSILLPSALAGAGAVALLLVTVRRVWGRAAGLVAGAALATMPVAVAVSRSNNPDVYLVLAAVAAAYAVERAVATSKLRWMLLAGAFVGVGFLAKLGAALIVAPALWLAFLVGSKLSWRARLVHATLGALMLGVVALGWVAAVDLTPASSRPYVGGSTDGTAWDLVTGYNGLGRVTGEVGGPGGGPGGDAPRPGRFAAEVPGGFPRVQGGGGPGGGGEGGIDQFGGATGLTRLFNNGMGDQVMWLAPLAAAATLGGIVLLVRRRLSKPQVASLVCFAGWAATAVVVFSYASGIFHNYYVSLLAPAVAALVGIGAKLVLDGGLVARAAGAVALAVTAWLQLGLLRRVDALEWLRVVVPAATIAVAVVLVVTMWRPRVSGRTGALVAGAAVAAVMMAPAAWSVASLGHSASGTFPDARPLNTTLSSGSGFGGFPGWLGDGLDESQLAWLREQRTTERWLIAVSSSLQASSAIIGGDSVMAIGGFNGGDATMTASGLAELVRNGDLRFVAGGGGIMGPGGLGDGGSGVTEIVSSVCIAVPATTWGGSGSVIYDCQGKAEAIEDAGASAATETSETPGNDQPAVGDQPSQPGGLGVAPGGAGGPGGVDVAELQACLADQGVTLDPASGPPDLSDPAPQKALAACGFALPGQGP